MNVKKYLAVIRQIVENELPGERAHFPLSPLNRPVSSEAMKNAIGYKESAVSILLAPRNEDTSITLIKRPSYDGKHSGQIAFPGGKRDEQDVSLLATSIRECYEEIGVELSGEMYLGKLTPVYIPISNFYVEPHLFYMDRDLIIKKDDFEVEEVFTITITDLLNPAHLQSDQMLLTGSFKKEVPCFRIQNRIIWGATALMLNELKEIILKTKVI